MDRINAVMTKIKSDLTLRIEGAMNEVQRRGLEIKDISKMFDDLRKYISFMNEGISISLAVSIAREVN
jgi:t-SNARE complex subunit (syntaxin)